MKYFSLYYSLNPKDYADYDKFSAKAFLTQYGKRLIFIVLVVVLINCFIEKDIFGTLTLFFLLFEVMAAALYMNFEYKNSVYKKSKLLTRPFTLDFYSDHFVVTSEPDKLFKGRNERHHGFDTVAAVLESKNQFYFIFKTNNMLIIPKRILDDERTEMIRNLINNLFSSIYRTI